MLTQSQKKIIKQLSDKAVRMELNCFLAEGEKIVNELLISTVEIKTLFALKGWIERNNEAIKNVEVIEISENELKQISKLKSANQVVAIAKIPNSTPNYFEPNKKISLFLDNINDPGNLGTIIRTADWFGIHQIFCSEQTVDTYNSKVIQAAMGSLFRVRVKYVNTELFFNECKLNKLKIIGADMHGKSVYDYDFIFPIVLVIGSESHGIDNVCKKFIQDYVTIPGSNVTDSLNVGVATGIICSEIMRKSF